MNEKIILQNNINRTEALIRFVKESALYAEEKKKLLIDKYTAELENYQLQQAKNIEVYGTN